MMSHEVSKRKMIGIIARSDMPADRKEALLLLVRGLRDKDGQDDRNETSWVLADDEEKQEGVALIAYRY